MAVTRVSYEVVYDTAQVQKVSHPYGKVEDACAFAEKVTAAGGEASRATVREVATRTVATYSRPE